MSNDNVVLIPPWGHATSRQEQKLDKEALESRKHVTTSPSAPSHPSGIYLANLYVQTVRFYGLLVREGWGEKIPLV